MTFMPDDGPVTRIGLGTHDIGLHSIPCTLHVPVGETHRVLDLSSLIPEGAFYCQLRADSVVTFREDQTEIVQPDEGIRWVLHETANALDHIWVDPDNIGPTTFGTCRHGFSPPSRCPVKPPHGPV